MHGATGWNAASVCPRRGCSGGEGQPELDSSTAASERTQGRVSDMKDRVMGSAEGVAGSARFPRLVGQS